MRKIRKAPTLGDGIAQLSAAGPMELTVVPAIQALLDPAFFRIARDFIQTLTRGGQRQCLACSHEWSTLECQPPAAFAFLTSANLLGNDSQTNVELVSPVCAACFASASTDLAARCVEQLREIWPELRQVVACDAPGVVQ